ncbi:MAG TPA: glycoside hydrolase family 15 protein [Solirubrobacterales bacterium]|nr:glycoside hydrolase family 15 protein [Solirubrobacterales bacterium]
MAVVVISLTLVSGRSSEDPRTPEGLPGLTPPFLGVAVVGSGGKTAAVDAYGNVVDLRAPGPAGEPLVAVSSDRQAAGTVPPDGGIVARAQLGGGETAPLWEANSVEQRYLPGTNVLWTVARFDGRRVVVTRGLGLRAVRADRRWIARVLPLGPGAPGWARRLYERSLLVLRALTDRHTGAGAAGARDSWAYVWPRDAGAVALAFAAAGYRAEARRVVRFLRSLDLEAAARFHGDGTPVEGRAAQGDAAGWLVAAERATGLAGGQASGPGAIERSRRAEPSGPWRGRADYQEGEAGDYAANAIASGVRNASLRGYFEHRKELVRVAGDPASGVDSAVAWAIRPFPRPALFPLVRRSLRHLLAERRTRFGIVPSESWHGGEDPWTAPTAWTAWAFATLTRHGKRSALAMRDRRTALGLMADLRRAATPLGLLPERVDIHTGLPTSTTPLAWSHAFAILALRELWP